jgi:HAD superfamily hydrolase (TIGR01484 family)
VLLFDLDDTLLDGTRLGEHAYSSLFRLRETGLGLLAVTGRPAGWGEVLARQWPVLGVIAENGAVAWSSVGERVTLQDPRGAHRASIRARLAEVVARISEELPDLRPADDVHARLTDFTFDIGEHERVDDARVERAVSVARSLGARTVRSSVHLHVSLDGADKASGAVRFLEQHLGLDPGRARHAAAFVGDSENDAACFAAFATTFGVGNLRGRPTVRPAFLAQAARGEGFAEIARALVALRARA